MNKNERKALRKAALLLDLLKAVLGQVADALRKLAE